MSLDHLRARSWDPALLGWLGDGTAWPCDGTSTGGGLVVLKLTRVGSDSLWRAAGAEPAFAAAEALGDAFARALACSSRR